MSMCFGHDWEEDFPGFHQMSAEQQQECIEEWNKCGEEFSKAFVRAIVGEEFWNTHTLEECRKEATRKIIEADLTYLYKRPYKIQNENNGING